MTTIKVPIKSVVTTSEIDVQLPCYLYDDYMRKATIILREDFYVQLYQTKKDMDVTIITRNTGVHDLFTDTRNVIMTEEDFLRYFTEFLTKQNALIEYIRTTIYSNK
jgi:hypothetical protein